MGNASAADVLHTFPIRDRHRSNSPDSETKSERVHSTAQKLNAVPLSKVRSLFQRYNSAQCNSTRADPQKMSRVRDPATSAARHASKVLALSSDSGTPANNVDDENSSDMSARDYGRVVDPDPEEDVEWHLQRVMLTQPPPFRARLDRERLDRERRAADGRAAAADQLFSVSAKRRRRRSERNPRSSIASLERRLEQAVGIPIDTIIRGSVETRRKRSQSHADLMALVDSNLKRGIGIRGDTRHPVTTLSSAASTSSKGFSSVASIHREYVYEVPNKFGVRMLTPYALFPYQEECIQWAVDIESASEHHPHFEADTRGYMLAVEMGLGKTLIVLTLIMRTLHRQETLRQPCLVVCPKNLLGTIRYEIEKFFGDNIRVLLYHRDFLRHEFEHLDENAFRSYHIVLTNYRTIQSRAHVLDTHEDDASMGADEKHPGTTQVPSAAGRLSHLFRSGVYSNSSASDTITHAAAAAAASSASSAIFNSKIGDGGLVGTTQEVTEVQSARTFLELQWYRIVFDESHELRNRGNKTTKACRRLVSKLKCAMTGTPMVNAIDDIYSQLECVGLKQLPKRTRENEETLSTHRIVECVNFINMEDVDDVELPPKHTSTEFVELDPEERRIHDFFVQEAASAYKHMRDCVGRRDKNKFRLEMKGDVLRGIQTCVAAAIITDTKSNAARKKSKGSAADAASAAGCSSSNSIGTSMRDVRHQSIVSEFAAFLADRSGRAGAQSSKIRATVRRIVDILTTDTRRVDGVTSPDKIIVFSNYVEPLRLMCESLRHHVPNFSDDLCVSVHGRVSGGSRAIDERLTKFRTDPRCRVLLMTLQIGNRGLNLTEANHLFFVSPWYSPAPMDQAEARIYRIGQKKPVYIYYMLAKDSVEERVYRIVSEKRELSARVQEACGNQSVFDDERMIGDVVMDTSGS